MRFGDASAVIPLIVNETSTPTLRSVFEEEPQIAVWWGTWVECLSALARRRRESNVTCIGHVTGRQELEDLAATWLEVLPVSPALLGAGRILRELPIAIRPERIYGPSAWHLALGYSAQDGFVSDAFHDAIHTDHVHLGYERTIITGSRCGP